MGRFLARRLAFSVIAVIGATMMVFGVSRAAGDPRILIIGDSPWGMTDAQWEELGRQLHLDKPIVVQYSIWLGRVLKGDLGMSAGFRKPVAQLIGEALPNTLRLALAAWLFATVVGVSLGVLAAVKRGTVWDVLARGFALLGQAIPFFWLGLLAIYLFSFELGWLPPGGRGQGTALRHYVLPAIIMGWLPAAGYVRLTRSSMLEVLDAEYVKFARAKGVVNFRVIWVHAFRNALLVPVTYSALLMVGLATGAIVTETVFSWPGIGRLVAQAADGNDYPLLVGTTLVFVSMYVTVVLLLDLVYMVIDPRVRHR